MSDWKPGTVAKVIAAGRDLRVIRDRGGLWFVPESVVGNAFLRDDQVTDVRPLVVLDIPVEKARQFVAWIREDSAASPGLGWVEAICSQIEAQTKPPRIPEPGLWGVVEAHTIDGSARRKFVRHDDAEDDREWQRNGVRRRWDSLIDPVLIREGLS